MSGPMGGGQGRQRVFGKGGRRFATRGLKIGSYVSITYRDPDRAHSAEPNITYEGKIVDKRVGAQDRDSYVELEDCLRINERGDVIAREGKKRLKDAFIQECEVVQPRQDRTPAHERAAEAMQWGAKMSGSWADADDLDDPASVGQASMAQPSKGQASMGQMMGQVPMGQMMPMGQMPMGQTAMEGMQSQGMSTMPMMTMPQGMQGMQGMQCMPMMPMQQMMPMMTTVPQMPMMMQGSQPMMMPMMGGWQGGQQMMMGGQQMMMMPMMMVPMMQSGAEAEAVKFN